VNWAWWPSAAEPAWRRSRPMKTKLMPGRGRGARVGVGRGIEGAERSASGQGVEVDGGEDRRGSGLEVADQR
jgi:hypothetical protein